GEARGDSNGFADPAPGPGDGRTTRHPEKDGRAGEPVPGRTGAASGGRMAGSRAPWIIQHNAFRTRAMRLTAPAGHILRPRASWKKPVGTWRSCRPRLW